MSETGAPEELVVTGYAINAAIEKWRVHCMHLACHGEIKKSVMEELDQGVAYQAKLKKLKQQYELEVHVRVAGTPLPLASVKFLMLELRRYHGIQGARVTGQSSYVEVVVLADTAMHLKKLKGIYLEGLGTKSTVTDPEIVENALVLGLT